MHHLLKKATLALTVSITVLFTCWQWGRSNAFYGDSLGYYLYLPSTFIYQNLKAPDNMQDAKQVDAGIKWYLGLLKENKTTLGNHLNQYTYGVALMELPFFVIAQGYQKLTGGPANGYSATYNNMIKVGNLLYAFLGLILVYKILRTLFDGNLSILGACITLLCTNLFWFTTSQPGMAHVVLFFLYAALIWLTIRVHKEASKQRFILLGLTMGLITLIRPTDVLCAAIPLLYNLSSRDTLRQKLQLMTGNKVGVLLLFLAFIVPIIPQLLYWKTLTGQYIYYSYGSQSFNWRHPMIKEGLFYFFNGWFPYSPIMLFALAGILFYKSIKPWFWCILILTPAYIYIVYSWYCWNYINGLGSRPMIHLYPLLAIPLTAVVQFVSKQRLFIKIGFGTLVCFFIALNLSYSVQQAKGIVQSQESSLAYNYQILFRSDLRYKDLVTRDLAERQPDTSKLQLLATPITHNFDDSLNEHYMPDTAKGSKYIYHIRQEEYTAIDSFVYDPDKFLAAKWLRCSGRFLYTECPGYYKHRLVLDINGKLNKQCTIENKIYDWDNKSADNIFSLDHCLTLHWGEVYFYTKVPKNIAKGDIVRIYLWNSCKTELYMDDVRVGVYR